MTMPLIRALAFSLLAVCAAGAATAQTYPSKPIRMIVPYPPGGSADVLARNLGHRLTQTLGQQIIVDNRPGAGTAIGAREAAAAPADGYTLLMGTVTSQAMNPALNPQVGYDPVKDFVAVAPVATIPFALVVRPTLAASNLKELIVMSKAAPGKLTFASAGVGTSNHLAGELLQSMAGIKLNHVPYKGSAPALNDLLGGHVDMMFDLVLTATNQVQSGKLRALAVTTRKRSAQLPDVPTFAELGWPDYEINAWFGVFAPAGVPGTIVEQLNAAIRKAVESPEMRAQLAAAGAEPMTGSPAQLATTVVGDYRKWAAIIRERGIQPIQ